MQAILVQPPFVQLNSPYPAIWYLKAFLESPAFAGTGHIQARAFDHSIEVYRALHSRAGIGRLFEDARKAITSKRPGIEARAMEEISRYLSYEGQYVEWIEGLVEFLSGGDPAFAHRLAATAEFPRGARAQAFLEAAGGRIRAEEARGLATAILEDLADFIRFALDPDFGTVRYGERLARSRGDFGEVVAGLESAWFVNAVYRPWLRRFWSDRLADMPEKKAFILITIPFPGCLAGALACARAAREAYGPDATIVAGGGYVSTELRRLSDPRVFDWFDFLSFDAGYGSLASILEGGELYRTMSREGGAVIGHGFGSDGARIPACAEAGAVTEAVTEAVTGAATDAAPFPETRWAALEREALETVFPNYEGVDFARYLRAVDSDNAMHRLWSDSPWLKYSLAHGCYWKRCSFCDTALDYVSNFVPARAGAVLAAADSAARRHALYGIHFVDEALPMRGLLEFARANRERATRGERPFSFWGNVRFDASWTAGRAEYLAASGLVAVSGGIEIATERGLEMTNKGFDLRALVKTLVGMRRAGLLVHAYLIYGFPGQGAEDIVDSAEVVRQLFAAGLVDSAFWHRFVLTRHSRMLAEHLAGRLPSLRPIDRGGTFADNDLEFEGESSFDAFDAPLVAALEAWMRGEELDSPAAELLERAGLVLPGARQTRRARIASTVPPDRVERLIEEAEDSLDTGLPPKGSTLHWIAGKPALETGQARPSIVWAYRGSMERLEMPGARAKRLHEALAALAVKAEGQPLGAFLEAGGLSMESDKRILMDLLAAGLVPV